MFLVRLGTRTSHHLGERREKAFDANALNLHELTRNQDLAAFARHGRRKNDHRCSAGFLPLLCPPPSERELAVAPHRVPGKPNDESRPHRAQQELPS